MPHFSPIRFCVFPVFMLLSNLVAFQAVQADTTVPITGIGTEITDGPTIKTHVDSVTYSDPQQVTVHGMPAMEIRGTVTGTGWGGTSLIPRAANEHYQYNIPFVARWRQQGAGPRLVFFNHGGGVLLMVAVRAEKMMGAANPNRTAELSADLLTGVPALLDHATYISINRRGLRNDGTFSAKYETQAVPPLTAAEVTSLQNQLGGFMQPGIAVGEPVPALPTNDAPTFRDIARALQKVVSEVQGMSYRTRIAIGSSSGARLLAAIDCGRTVDGPSSLRTGGNHVIPYDTSSPRIFDGFILWGFTYIAGTPHVDDVVPLSAPVMLFQGQADERYQQHVTLAYELMQKGVKLRNRVWMYEIENMTHVTRDIEVETAGGPDGDRLACFLSAGIRNLRMFLECRTPPPASRMTGRVVAGQLQIDQIGGAMTNVTPVPNDSVRDRVIPGPQLGFHTLDQSDTERWLKVIAVLPHVHDAITPPTVACRLGGYELMFFGSKLVPDSPSALKAKYGSFECYRCCVSRNVQSLESQRLYDARVESASETAERARSLFMTPAPCPVVMSTGASD